MPTVPRIDTFQVTPTADPNVANRLPDMPDAGLQAKQAGEAAGQVADAAFKMQYDMQDEANRLRVIEASNQAKEQMYNMLYDKDSGALNQKGWAALNRESGKALPDEYADKLKEVTDGISGGLGNDRQRRMFQEQALGMQAQMRGTLDQHLMQEFNRHKISTFDGTISNESRAIALAGSSGNILVNQATGQSNIDEAAANIMAAVREKARASGLSQVEADAAARKALSNAHTLAVAGALEANKPEYADAYLKKYINQMDADDILRVKGKIDGEVSNRIGLGVAGQIFSKVQGNYQPTDGTRAFNILLKTESGGKQFDKDGKPLTSSAGAIGIAQVMPGTAPEAAKLAGLPWDETRYKNDPEYNKALGLAYFQKQLQNFGGNLAQAFAAYNAGEQAVRDYRDGTNKSGKNPKGIKTPDGIPPFAETQKYVAANMAAYESGGGASPIPTLQELHNAARSNPALADNPRRLKIALDELTRRHEEALKARKQGEDDATAEALRVGMQNGYRISAIPQSVLSRVPPDKLDNVRNTLASLAQGDKVDNPVAYQNVVSNPSMMAKMSDQEWFVFKIRNFSPETAKHFDDERAKLTGAVPNSNGPGELNTSAITDAVNIRLRQINVNPTPQSRNLDEAARVGTIRKFVNDSILAAQRGAGRKFTDAEVITHIDQLFGKNVHLRGTILGVDLIDSSMPLFSMGYRDIPSAERDAIKKSWQNTGVANPTDAQVLEAYMRNKVSNK